jgi:predicted amino acid-binding ACT domain protein
MTALAFDTYAAVKRLKDAGFTETQAEAQTALLVDIIETELATKRDIKELEVVIRQVEAATKRDIKELEVVIRQVETTTQRDIENLHTELKRDIKELEVVIRQVEIATQRDIANLRTELKRDIKELELRLETRLEAMKADLTKWIIGLLLAQTGLIAALVKLL